MFLEKDEKNNVYTSNFLPQFNYRNVGFEGKGGLNYIGLLACYGGKFFVSILSGFDRLG